MKRQTQSILYHLLPVTFWLLAIGGIVLGEIYHLQSTIYNYIPALLALLSLFILRRIPRHSTAVEPCFQVAVLLGVAAYWLPSVLILILPALGYLIYNRLLDLRSFLALLMGLALVVVWWGVWQILHQCPFAIHPLANLYAWIPVGLALFAYIASTIARQILRVR